MMKLIIIYLYIILAIGFSNHPIPTVRLFHGIESQVVLSNYIEDEQSCVVESSDDLNTFIQNDSLFIQQKNSRPAISTVKVNCNKNIYNIIVNKEYTVPIKFKLLDDFSILKVFLMGSFNDWDRTSLPLKKESDFWQLTKHLEPGSYEYKFVVDQKEIIDPANSDSIPNGLGGWNSLIIVDEKNRNSAGQFVKKSFQIDDSLGMFNFEFIPGKSKDRLNIKNLLITVDNQIIEKDNYNFKNNKLNIRISKNINGLLRICAVNNYNQIIQENHTIVKNGQPLSVNDKLTDNHFNIIYSLIIDRFNNGNLNNDNPVNDPDLNELGNFQGGDLRGIFRKLSEGYFSDLGVNMLWISPVMKNPDSSRTESIHPYRRYSGYHGYWPESSREIDPRFGTDDDFKLLITKAHSRGIKVILDFVANHVYENHPYYLNHPEWFSSYINNDGLVNLRQWDGDTRLTTWFESYLPTFDYQNNPEAVDRMVKDAVNIVEVFNIDGFRQDATKHIPHLFWKSLTQRLKKSFPDKDIFQIGETFGSSDLIKSYVNPVELQSQFNFDLYFKLRKVFSSQKSEMIDLNNFIQQNIKIFQPINLMGTITSSHDQVRFMALADNQINLSENGRERSFYNLPQKVINSSSYDKLFMFSTVNFMLPGIPVVYYGEEYGQIGANDPGNRLKMRFPYQWNSIEREYNEKYKKIVHLRHNNPAPALGDLVIIYQTNHCTVWLKRYFDKAVLVMFNYNSEPYSLKLNIDNQFKIASSVLGQDSMELNKSTSLLLAPYETRVYELHN